MDLDQLDREAMQIRHMGGARAAYAAAWLWARGRFGVGDDRQSVVYDELTRAAYEMGLRDGEASVSPRPQIYLGGGA